MFCNSFVVSGLTFQLTSKIKILLQGWKDSPTIRDYDSQQNIKILFYSYTYTGGGGVRVCGGALCGGARMNAGNLEARRACQIPGSWSYRQCEPTVTHAEGQSHPLEELETLSTSEPSLQACPAYFGTRI